MSRYILLLLLLIAALLPALAEPVPEPPLPTYTVTRIARELKMSGKADDPLWAQAEAVTLTDADTGKPAQFNTTVRVLYSQRYLYVAIACEDDYAWGTLKNHDDNIFQEECVEVFLAPSGSFRSFFEIEVSPLNTVLDSYQLSRSLPDGSYRRLQFLTSYTCEGLVTKVFVDGELNKKGGAKGWTVEYAIPFTAIVGRDNIVPIPGDRWRANFARIDTPEPEKPTFASWSPLGYHDFNRSYRFGWMVFK
jgi:hypothetical protein